MRNMFFQPKSHLISSVIFQQHTQQNFNRSNIQDASIKYPLKYHPCHHLKEICKKGGKMDPNQVVTLGIILGFALYALYLLFPHSPTTTPIVQSPVILSHIKQPSLSNLDSQQHVFSTSSNQASSLFTNYCRYYDSHCNNCKYVKIVEQCCNSS